MARLESDIIDEMKQTGQDICDLITLKSEKYLENQKINEEKSLLEEKLAVEQRKYESYYDEQLKQNQTHMNSMNYSYIPYVEYSPHYRPNYPQAAYPMKWVRFQKFNIIIFTSLENNLMRSNRSIEPFPTQAKILNGQKPC